MGSRVGRVESCVALYMPLHFTQGKMGCAWEAMDIMICILFKRTTLGYYVKNGPKEGKVGSREAA